MSAQSRPRRSDADEGFAHYRRRPLSARALLPAIGIGVGAGVGVGLATYYLVKLFLERAPLLPDADTPRGRGRSGERRVRSEGSQAVGG